MHRLGEALGLLCDLLLLVAWECRKGIKLGSNEKWYRCLHIPCYTSAPDPVSREKGAHLIEPPRLTVPLFDRIERRLAREVEHE